MVKLRFRRKGRKKVPVFSLVATDSRSPRDGRYIEDLGRFYPVSSTDELTLNRERILYWLQQGAQPSDSVRNILRKEGVMLELYLIRKGVEPEEIESQVEAHRARWAEKAAAAQTESSEERRKKALEKERKAAAEERRRIEKERQEREAELERQRKEAEEAERAAAAEKMKEKEDGEKKEAAAEDAAEDEAAEAEASPEEKAVEAEAETEEAPEEAEAETAEEKEAKSVDEAAEEASEKADVAEERRTAPRVQEGGKRIESEETAQEEPEPDVDVDDTEAAAADEEKEEKKEEAKADAGEAEAEPEPAAEAEPEDTTPDTLTDVWGIGPKYASILNDAGIQTFAALAEKSVEDLQTIITDAGSTTAGNEETWAEQASFLAEDDKDGHDALVKKLKAD